ncbi:MAG TPA: selenoneine biosynthesis selenosugar synthase SenB [Burkholderiales bacterium]|nr:selenoneine biosynthesis selenosugar synthase SenB [Burkholderiales bacterium]
MRISLITPAPHRSRYGNRNTASRWAGFLRELGHTVTIEQLWSPAASDMMIALHARRSADSISRYAAMYPRRPLVVMLTGTDLYNDIASSEPARVSLALATRLVVLQELGPRAVPAVHRAKVRVIYQSALVAAQPPLTSCFEVVVSGHLREVKDPFRAAAALSLLPDSSRIRLTHIGGALDSSLAAEAGRWMKREPRYRWLGELPRWRALRVLGRSRVMVISSRMEGGANVVGEAIAAHVPVIASRVPGNVGMLGPRHPGYFPFGDERALARFLVRAEQDGDFYARLRSSSVSRASLVTPARERRALEQLLSECGRALPKAAA